MASGRKSRNSECGLHFGLFSLPIPLEPLHRAPRSGPSSDPQRGGKHVSPTAADPLFEVALPQIRNVAANMLAL